MGTATETREQRIAADSGLSVEEVERRLADGLLWFREQDYWGGEQPPGEWVDAKPTEVVVAGGGYWGKGADEAAAKAEFRRQGGRLGEGYVVLTFGPGSYFVGINAMGWRYLGEPPAHRTVEPRGKR